MERTHLEILTYGNPQLVVPSREITRVDGEIRALAEEMFETMVRENGIGLAAPQIGENIRLFVLGIVENRVQTRMALVNPRIVASFGDQIPFEEGCLSVPGIHAEVIRPAGIVVEGLDLSGEPVRLEAGGLMARVMQHEIDHLDGRLFVDRLDRDSYRAVERALIRLRNKTGKRLDRRTG